ncbi:hypothetical protein QFW82_16725 [Streptomyces malaysiensis subsp. malaysiensis]|uniref:hypothetical protein n=1 Tax=Streptomyces malaysiensis TaxID=92644 RepID=UPI0024C0CE45|nr:hypothetical protein [Streptomyces sp. NA07423]WHX18580.1 hypothetical protein QFW82_16725 [Streptomyces sp. NA07423]
MKGKGKNYKGKDSVIVVAGEGDNDRKVLWHLIRALRPDAKIVNIKKKTALRDADKELTPRVDELRRLAQAASIRSELAGIVVHVDLDLVHEEKYDEVRRRISTELRSHFSCPSAIALAAWEIEAWLMQFPAAFARVNTGWILKAKYQKGCDLTKIHDPKARLKEHPWNPPYEASYAPHIMEKAFNQDGKLMQPDGKNRSYEEFIAELTSW